MFVVTKLVSFARRVEEPGRLPQIHSMHTLPGSGRTRPGMGALCFVLILLPIFFCFPVSALTAETQDRCTEKAEREFQGCVKKAKNDKDRDACERQFAIDYDKCNVIWEGSEE